MGNDSDNYENDPYIQQSQNNNALQNLYTRQGLNSYDRNVDTGVSVQQLSKQQEKLNTTAYQNPIKIDRNSIKLEKDAYDPHLFYITFEYSCVCTIYANFYFNAEFTPNNNESMFTPSPPFQNGTIRIWLPPGENKKYQDPSLKVNVNDFLKNKVYGRKYFDLIMELYVMDNERKNIECILATFCSLIFKPGTDDFKLKYLCQKVKVRNTQWYDLEDVFGLTTDEKLCEICYTNPRNTFFLPCKHSYTCQDCAILIRTKDDRCPICRQKIADSVVLTNANADVDDNNETNPNPNP